LLTARDVPERRLSSVLKVIWHVPPFRDVPGCQQTGGDLPRFADTSRLRFLQPIARAKNRKPETKNSCLSRGKAEMERERDLELQSPAGGASICGTEEDPKFVPTPEDFYHKALVGEEGLYTTAMDSLGRLQDQVRDYIRDSVPSHRKREEETQPEYETRQKNAKAFRVFHDAVTAALQTVALAEENLDRVLRGSDFGSEEPVLLLQQNCSNIRQLLLQHPTVILNHHPARKDMVRPKFVPTPEDYHTALVGDEGIYITAMDSLGQLQDQVRDYIRDGGVDSQPKREEETQPEYETRQKNAKAFRVFNDAVTAALQTVALAEENLNRVLAGREPRVAGALRLLPLDRHWFGVPGFRFWPRQRAC